MINTLMHIAGSWGRTICDRTLESSGVRRRRANNHEGWRSAEVVCCWDRKSSQKRQSKALGVYTSRQNQTIVPSKVSLTNEDEYQLGLNRGAVFPCELTFQRLVPLRLAMSFFDISLVGDCGLPVSSLVIIVSGAMMGTIRYATIQLWCMCMSLYFLLAQLWEHPKTGRSAGQSVALGG